MTMASKSVVLEDLSALVDGEVDAQSAAALSEAWRQDPELRARWHGYQLIGDVLRSPELAGAGRGAAFLAALRGRLAQEPVVLAPAPLEAPEAASSAASPLDGGQSGLGGQLGVGSQASLGGHRPARPRAALRRWAPPAALAAGFLVVAVGSLTLLRPPAPAGAVIATSAPVSAPALTAGSASARVAPGAGVEGAVLVNASLGQTAADLPERATGVMIRDARLDGYLAAHKQFGGSSALGLPSGFLRSATHQGAAAPVEP
jgi:sigma-E factor negative regulatory protein RseA